MKRRKRLKVGETVTQTVIDRDGNKKQVTSIVTGYPDQPADLEEVKKAMAPDK